MAEGEKDGGRHKDRGKSVRLKPIRIQRFSYLIFKAVVLITIKECMANSLQIPNSEIKCALLDSMYLNEDFENEVAKSLEVTNNFAADPAFEFATKFPLAIVACLDGFEAYAGSIVPVILDAMKEEHENKGSLAGIIELHEKRTEIRSCIIYDNLIIQSILEPLRTMRRNIGGVCTHLESAHRDLYKMVLQLSSRNYGFRNVPSATSQLLLTIAPVATMISQHIPYLEWNTKANCKLRNLFEDLFQHALLHRFQKIDIACIESLQCQLHYNDLVSSTLKNKLNTSILKPERDYIRCSKNREGDFAIKDNLEFIRNERTTTYYGDMLCLRDYFSLVRHRLESHFAKAIIMLSRRCSNFRGTPTGNIH